jgi:ABC-type nitrate/sulfonate/bicarbonate transport system permease component
MARVEATSPGTAVPAPVSSMLRNTFWSVAPIVTPALVLIVWEYVTRSGDVSAFMLPSIGAVLARLMADVMSGDFLVNAALTLYRTFCGFAIAAVAGVTLGVLMARSRWAHWFFDPIVSIGFPMPKIAFLPVFILWFGLFDATKITIIAVSAVFPVIAATLAGLQGVERELIWSAQSLGVTARRLAFEIMVPAALPQIITGLQVALPIALIVAIVTEMFMGGYGLGGAMNTAARFADSRGVFAGIVEIAVIGYALVKGMGLIRRRLLLWHQEAIAPSTV